MSSYEDQFVKIEVVIHVLYSEKEGGDPANFFLNFW